MVSTCATVLLVLLVLRVVYRHSRGVSNIYMILWANLIKKLFTTFCQNCPRFKENITKKTLVASFFGRSVKWLSL